jgi:potassium-transporting ATPase KdpC subunit
MVIFRDLFRAFRIILVLWIITAVIYPLIILGVGQSFFKYQANGSIMVNLEAKPIGSVLIGQQFKSDKYFQGRPSAVRYSQGKSVRNTGISGGSNLAPSNKDLVSRVVTQANKLRDENVEALPELIYASGSGLDPHISVKAAIEQIDRIARTRSLQPKEVKEIVEQYIDGRFLWIFGEPGVNILRLNYFLDLRDVNKIS